MGVLGLAITALALMASVTGASAVTGAVMGSRREIGAVKGFLWGLFLPVIGVGRVWISDKLTPGDTRAAVPAGVTVRQVATAVAKEQFAKDNPVRRNQNAVRRQSVQDKNVTSNTVSQTKGRKH